MTSSPPTRRESRDEHDPRLVNHVRDGATLAVLSQYQQIPKADSVNLRCFQVDR